MSTHIQHRPLSLHIAGGSESACNLCRHHQTIPLPCSHHLCSECIARSVPDFSLSIACPLCGDISILPPEAMDEPASPLQQALSISQPPLVLASSTASAARGAEDMAISPGGARTASVDMPSVPSTPAAMACPYHTHEELKYYCETCATALCQRCLRSDGATETFEHSTHIVVLLKDAVLNHRARLRDTVEKAQLKHDEMLDSIASFDKLSVSVSNKSDETASQIDECFRNLEKLLTDRRSRLEIELKEATDARQIALLKQKDALQCLLNDVRRKCEITKETVESGNEAEILLVAKEIAAKLEEFCMLDAKTIVAEAGTAADTVLGDDCTVFQQTNTSQIEGLISTLGAIVDRSHSVAEASASGAGLRVCCVGRHTYVVLTTRNHKGEPIIVEPLAVIQAQLLTHQNKLFAAVHVSSNDDGTYDLTYVCEREGTFFLSIKVCDKPIEGSPFVVRCLNDEQFATIAGKSPSRVSFVAASTSSPSAGPTDHQHVYSNPSEYCSVHGRIIKGPDSYASTSVSGRRPPMLSSSSRKSHSPTRRLPQTSSVFVTKAAATADALLRNLSPPSQGMKVSSATAQHANIHGAPVVQIDDDLLLKVGCKGRHPGEFSNPQGIACTSDNRIIVTDSGNQCVQIFNEEGECKLRFGTRGRSPGQIQRPTGVATLPNGNIVIADYDTKWISIFDLHGHFVSRFGGGKLLGPKGVAVTDRGQIVVVDNKASTVFVFSPTGKFIRKFGSRGCKPHQFAGPHYVACSRQQGTEQLYITDFHNHCVKVFDASSGQYMFKFGSNGEGNGQFNAPTGIAVDDYDSVVVADWGNNRIQVFDANGSFLSFVNSIADGLYGPQDLAATPDGTIAVADSGSHCYKIYKYLV